MHAKVFLLLFVAWALYKMGTIYVKLFLGLSSQNFEEVFVCGFIILFLCCFCSVIAAFICMFSIFMTYSTSYSCHYKLMHPWNACSSQSELYYLSMQW